MKEWSWSFKLTHLDLKQELSYNPFLHPMALILNNLNIIMNKYLLLIFLLLFNISYSQKIYSTDYSSQSDIKLFVVNYESQADLNVFKVDYKSQAKGNEGLWYFVEYSSQADKKIFFVDYESQSDLKIYFVKYKSQAGWQNKSKKALLY